MKTKVCPSCKKEFNGRRNKKFCSIPCKNQYHNEEYRDANKTVFSVNKVLSKNRIILKNLYEIYRSSPISTEILAAHGFNDKFHTHLFSAPSGEKYTMIYELGYKTSIDNQIQIVELQEDLV